MLQESQKLFSILRRESLHTHYKRLSNNSDFVLCYGKTLYDNELFVDALQILQQASRLKPSSDLIYDLGKCYQQAKNYKEAGRNYTLASYMVLSHIPKAGWIFLHNLICGLYIQGMTRKEIYNLIVKNGFRGKLTSFYAWFNKAFPDYLKQNKVNNDTLKNLSIAIKQQTISSRKLSIYVTSPTFGINKSTSECSEEYKFTHELMDKSIELTEIKNFSDQFRYILKKGDENELDYWIESVLKSDFKKLYSFAKGIKKDIESVANAIKHNYTNGLVEGFVNRLKTKKREMYGRAGFELLRRKVCLSIMG